MDIGYIVTVLGVILVSMTLHEAMHGFMAYYLGDDTAKLQGRLTLNPIKHIDPFLTIILPVLLAISGGPIFGGAKPVPFNPSRVRHGEWGVALVGLVGPLTNLLISFVCFGVFSLLGGSISSASLDLSQSILLTAVFVNLGFFIFNMLPIPPLDGSRVLYALAPDFLRKIMEVIEQYGIVLVFVLVLLASQALGQFMVGSIQSILALFQIVFGSGG